MKQWFSITIGLCCTFKDKIAGCRESDALIKIRGHIVVHGTPGIPAVALSTDNLAKEYFASEAALKASGKDNTMNQFV